MPQPTNCRPLPPARTAHTSAPASYTIVHRAQGVSVSIANPCNLMLQAWPLARILDRFLVGRVAVWVNFRNREPPKSRAQPRLQVCQLGDRRLSPLRRPNRLKLRARERHQVRRPALPLRLSTGLCDRSLSTPDHRCKSSVLWVSVLQLLVHGGGAAGKRGLTRDRPQALSHNNSEQDGVSDDLRALVVSQADCLATFTNFEIQPSSATHALNACHNIEHEFTI